MGFVGGGGEGSLKKLVPLKPTVSPIEPQFLIFFLS